MSYTATQVAATRLLAAKGTVCNIAQLGVAVYNPATSIAAPTGGGNLSVNVAFLDFKEQSMASRQNSLGSRVAVGQRKVLVAAVDTAGVQFAAIYPGDVITDARAEPWVVEQVKVLDPGGVPLLYTCTVSK